MEPASKTVRSIHDVRGSECERPSSNAILVNHDYPAHQKLQAQVSYSTIGRAPSRRSPITEGALPKTVQGIDTNVSCSYHP